MAVPDDRKLNETIQHLKENMLMVLQNRVRLQNLQTMQYRDELKILLRNRIAEAQFRIERCRLILEENHPQGILEKGYAMIEQEDGTVIVSASSLEEGRRYRIRMQDGSVMTVLTELQKEDEPVAL